MEKLCGGETNFREPKIHSDDEEERDEFGMSGFKLLLGLLQQLRVDLKLCSEGLLSFKQ